MIFARLKSIFTFGNYMVLLPFESSCDDCVLNVTVDELESEGKSQSPVDNNESPYSSRVHTPDPSPVQPSSKRDG
jgi:hypothetical protein